MDILEYGYLGVRPEDVRRDPVIIVGDATSDGTVAMKIRFKGNTTYPTYIGSVNIVTTTNDLFFRQGTTTALSCYAYGTNPKCGGTAGYIDLSSSTVNTMYKLCKAINYGDWEAWLVDVPGDVGVEISAGVGKFLKQTKRMACYGTTYISLGIDTSLQSSDAVYMGLTANGPSTNLHPHDGGWIHRILQLQAKASFATVACSIQIWDCDDVNGTSTLKDTNTYAIASSGTAITRGDGVSILYEAQGHRLVAKLAGGSITTAIGLRTWSLKFYRESFPFAPGVSKNSLESSWESL